MEVGVEKENSAYKGVTRICRLQSTVIMSPDHYPEPILNRNFNPHPKLNPNTHPNLNPNTDPNLNPNTDSNPTQIYFTASIFFFFNRGKIVIIVSVNY